MIIEIKNKFMKTIISQIQFRLNQFKSLVLKFINSLRKGGHDYYFQMEDYERDFL